MTSSEPAAGASESVPPLAVDATRLVAVRVWDWPVRAFHWTLLGLVAFSVFTVKAGGTWMEWHMRSGYAVLALLAFRVLWGFAGTRWARWSTFVRGPATALRYARTLVASPHETSVGHNPLGGYMVVVLVAALLVQAITGLFANDDILTEGPLAKLISKDLSDRLTSVHGFNEWVLYALVAVHVLAVLFHRVRFDERLVTAMFTGVKKLPERFAGAGIGATPHARALVLAALCALAVWWLVTKV
jgi:cytochrome b